MTASVLQVRELSRELHDFGGRRGSSKPTLVSTEPPAHLQGHTKPPRGMLLYAIHCPCNSPPSTCPHTASTSAWKAPKVRAFCLVRGRPPFEARVSPVPPSLLPQP